MNELLGTLSKMPPEQLLQLLGLFTTAVIAPIMTIFGLYMRSSLKHQDRKHESALRNQEAERTAQLNKQQTELDMVKSQMDLKFQEQKAQSEQLNHAFELLGKQMEGINNLAEAQRETNRIHAGIEAQHSQDIKGLNDKIAGVGDILEVQAGHFQSLSISIQDVKGLKLEFDAVRADIAAYKESVEAMINRLEGYTVVKNDIDLMRQNLALQYEKIEQGIAELKTSVSEIQSITEPLKPIEKEAEKEFSNNETSL